MVGASVAAGDVRSPAVGGMLAMCLLRRGLLAAAFAGSRMLVVDGAECWWCVCVCQSCCKREGGGKSEGLFTTRELAPTTAGNGLNRPSLPEEPSITHQILIKSAGDSGMTPSRATFSSTHALPTTCKVSQIS